ncbi:hypothetical protein CFC21_062831 [Triticum aestivum]|uniref:Uncharacterized protein n=2 Tax=Triticum aestivum TaxID=4565 RepID=A0A9R1GXA0_WHEAT|nr:hypothetical protein CFC21_062831 [Triticum aestivum]
MKISMGSSATMARAVLIAAVLLVQCCNVVVAARLLEGDRGWLHGGVGAAGALIMQVLPGGSPGAGTPNGCTNNPNHPPGGPCNGGR